MYSNSELAGLIRDDAVHRSVYTDPEIFELEMRRIWGRAWIYVAHESQVPLKGSFFTTTLARQPVLLVRQDDETINLFFNRCAHKGAKVIEVESGRAPVLRCGYHGWSYEVDGRCKHVTGGDAAYKASGYSRKDPCMGLQKVPGVASYRGFIFASLAPDAPDLRTWLGATATSIDNMVDRSPEGKLEVTGGVLRYHHDSNWKFFVENLNDMMHAMIAHQSSAQTARVMGKELFPDDPNPPAEIQILSPFAENTSFFEEMGVHAFDNGHSYSGGKTSIHANYSGIPEYEEAMEKAYGKERVAEIFSLNRHNTVVYPGFTLKGAIQTIRVVKPVAVDQTVIESWTLRLVGAPEEMLRRSILYCNLINSSGNLVGPDDHEAYHRLQNGLTTDAGDWVSMGRYLGNEEPNDEGGFSATGSSDMVFRSQFKAWKNYMTANGAGD
ncbi:MAG: aromatic ring-hydroxylating dioxygenase subunit alpha [Gammaproteobacteria bacterium]|nr:aromatic ring-hydroxylating dioxygenase subunit alpha [Gammaproteobacteria bacterium]